jgi:hypothetical protein
MNLSIAIHKIYRCIKSCNTREQLDNAVGMLMRYHKNRSNTLSDVLLLMTVHDFAETKGKLLILSEHEKTNNTPPCVVHKVVD